MGLNADTTAETYALKNIKPGTYRLTLTVGYSRGLGPEVQRAVTLVAGQKLTMDFAMPSSSLITGRVLDENERPVQKAKVHAIDRLYSRGILRYITIAHAETDEHGVYRLERLPAGHSLLVRADGVTDEGDSATDTFFPGTTSLDAAQEIVLAPGEGREGVDIRRIKQPSYCVDGTVGNGAGTDWPGVEVTRTIPIMDRLGPIQMKRSAADEPAQGFAFCGLHNGRYGMMGATGSNEGRQFNEGTAVVSGSDLHRLSLRPAAKVTLSGETVWDGEPPANASEAKLMIHFGGTNHNGQRRAR
jgi:hypothetical protein